MSPTPSDPTTSGADAADAAPPAAPPADVVFISSLGHSGSTVLERALSTHERVVGLGEVHQLLRTMDDRTDVDRHPCGCGATVGACPLWSVAMPALRDAPRDAVERYRIVLAAARQVLGPEAVLVDSSKSAGALRDLSAAGARIQVIDLTRDVRSWTVAMRDRAARRRRDPAHRAHGPRAVLRERASSTSWALFRTWHQMNRDRRAALAATGLPVTSVGYEPFVGDPGDELARLLRAVGLDPGAAATDGDLRAATTHTIFGNNMKLAPDLRERIVADGRWMARNDWQLPALVLRRAMEDNRRWVHASATPRPFGR